jgi:hypothetical protein
MITLEDCVAFCGPTEADAGELFAALRHLLESHPEHLN